MRLTIIAKLGGLQEVIGAEQVASALVPEIVALSEDPQWRVRLAIIDQLPMLAKNIGAVQFDSKLVPVVYVSFGWVVTIPRD